MLKEVINVVLGFRISGSGFVTLNNGKSNRKTGRIDERRGFIGAFSLQLRA